MNKLRTGTSCFDDGEARKKQLSELYIKQGKPIADVASQLGYSGQTIHRWLKQYGIPIRTISEAQLKGKPKPTKNELEELYIEQGKSTIEIAEAFNVSNVTIGKWLKEYALPTRIASETQLKGRKRPTKEELRRLYLQKGKTIDEIAKKLSFSHETICRYLRQYPI